MGVFLIVVSFFISTVVSDVYFEQLNDLYQVPFRPVSTTSQPILPEIIINRKTKTPGYIYNKPESSYIPSQSIPILPTEEQFPLNPLSPNLPTVLPFPPIIAGDALVSTEENTPNQEYLPPHTSNHPDIIVSFPEEDPNIINGYNYNRPTPTTVHTPVFPPELDISAPPDQQSGYIYNYPQSPSASYLPPLAQRGGKDMFEALPKNPIRLKVTEMLCILSQGGYFKSVLKIDSFLVAVPVVDNDFSGTGCDFRFYRSHLIVNISFEDFQKCGVVYCGNNNLCLRIRFPIIQGMKTATDSVLTLQCKAQDRVVTKTHALKITTNDVLGRGLGAYAQGGNQQLFRSNVELRRKTLSGFTQPLEANGAVQLGEELQLRAQIRAGDGWNYTRLSDVQLQRMSPSREILNSVVLVTPAGCINPSMRMICPTAPIFDPPLGHRLYFKAVMFQGMRSGDEMQMTIKIIGCMERKDCLINEGLCENDQNQNSYGRLRRNAQQNFTEYSDISTISFRVELPEVITTPKNLEENQFHYIVAGVATLIVFIGLAGIILCSKMKV